MSSIQDLEAHADKYDHLIRGRETWVESDPGLDKMAQALSGNVWLDQDPALGSMGVVALVAYNIKDSHEAGAFAVAFCKAMWDAAEELPAERPRVLSEQEKRFWRQVRPQIGFLWETTWNLGMAGKAAIPESRILARTCHYLDTLNCIKEYAELSPNDNLWPHYSLLMRERAQQLGMIKGDKHSPSFDRFCSKSVVPFLEAGGLMLYHLGCIVVGVSQPDFNEIELDGLKVLHNPDGPACSWGTGPHEREWYMWNGNEVPAHFINDPDSVDIRKEVLGETNSEQRRRYLEILGWGRILPALKTKRLNGKDPIDSKYGGFFEAKIDGEIEKFLSLECTTSGKEYFFMVPPDCISARHALGWKFTPPEVLQNPDSAAEVPPDWYDPVEES